MNPQQPYVQEGGLSAAALGSESVILHAERGLYFGTNELGTRIFELLAQPMTQEQIVELLVTEYDVSAERLREDVKTFLANMEENGLIRPVSP